LKDGNKGEQGEKGGQVRGRGWQKNQPDTADPHKKDKKKGTGRSNGRALL